MNFTELTTSLFMTQHIPDVLSESPQTVRIQKRFALSPRPFSKAIEMTIEVFKSVSPVDMIENLSLCLYNAKTP
ncbi:hypothetical protein E2C01_000033 [Portunus trituberculatus]|uniref:Uncharacterized protein n=1 Tax=Portunus trituberculatus TaxID=210409 RepID=A0A5B7CFF8_PORTR|nr:hypothetical protein [Portunus trituberculatus]